MFSDHEANTLGLEVSVRYAVGTQKLGPPHLEPDRINAVVHHPGLVGLGVTRHNLYPVTANS